VVVNVVVFELPGAMSPVAQTPESLVELCVSRSLFVHVTVVFFATVMVGGSKAMFAMITVFGGTVTGDGEVGADPYEFDELFLQPATSRSIVASPAFTKVARIVHLPVVMVV
jgi:hypothetical protein